MNKDDRSKLSKLEGNVCYALMNEADIIETEPCEDEDEEEDAEDGNS